MTHHRYRSGLFPIGVVAACLLAVAPASTPGQVAGPSAVRVVTDDQDAVVRRTDACGAQFTCGPTPMPLNAVLPDVIELRVGRFLPADATADLYTGAFALNGPFLRIDIRFQGLVNPPGPTVNTYQPQLYGPNPVLGFLELDVDTNGNTGGEVDAPLLRYLGNAARFGGKPAGVRFADRVSIDGRDPDNLIDTPPWIERSGADFELELRGDEITAIVHVAGDNDGLFEACETWDLRGRFFRRTQGYEQCAGGAYTPEVWLRFRHGAESATLPCPASMGVSATAGFTEVSFVYPLTNAAYASANDTAPEANDAFDFNANSILEALVGVHQAALLQFCPASDDGWTLLADWANQDPITCLDPQRWRCTMLWGTARSSAIAGEGNYIWTDIVPNVLPGDYNGDGHRTRTDARMAHNFVVTRDADPDVDADLTSNGVVELVDFGPWFSVFDVDYDGFVDADDVAFAQQLLGDFDNDGDVDLADYAHFQICAAALSLDVTESTVCRDAFDADQDGAVGPEEYAAFVPRLNGPGPEME